MSWHYLTEHKNTFKKEEQWKQWWQGVPQGLQKFNIYKLPNQSQW